MKILIPTIDNDIFSSWFINIISRKIEKSEFLGDTNRMLIDIIIPDNITIPSNIASVNEGSNLSWEFVEFEDNYFVKPIVISPNKSEIINAYRLICTGFMELDEVFRITNIDRKITDLVYPLDWALSIEHSIVNNIKLIIKDTDLTLKDSILYWASHAIVKDSEQYVTLITDNIEMSPMFSNGMISLMAAQSTIFDTELVSRKHPLLFEKHQISSYTFNMISYWRDKAFYTL